jgi:hypothetical protein
VFGAAVFVRRRRRIFMSNKEARRAGCAAGSDAQD